ncbi:ABC transporter permease [Ureibacillus sp. FSL K6-8385]|uniref:ABC transporter permease n=1 Tax=Ureibacillus terrenus TaxID=118246 RepID=A0A540UWX5_9BACL|nr:ABC transporter permease [Ureibacillus terrenus]MED3661760.1 ABC transporter permease [Ureibacillus terrenus]MED3763458.1 ABC transporter permease [Ureibacillus terrenus]TQE88995.1 ABC transporter permease [Ureibacillus terrenus]
MKRRHRVLAFHIGKFILKRTLKFVTLLFAVVVLTFMLVSLSPVDPIQSYLGAEMMVVSEEQKEEIAEYYGVNQPKLQQFFKWLKMFLQGDLGTSLVYRQDVLSIIQEKFVASFALMALSWSMAGILGYALGVIAGMNKGTFADRAIKLYCFVLASTPTFWIAILLLIVFSLWLGLFPIGLGTPIGVVSEQVTWLDRLKHILLPAATLSVIGVSNITLHTRQKVIDVLDSEFIRFARAKGEEGFTLFKRHVFRNTLFPAISVHFASFGELFGGAILAEQVFSYPGLGLAIVQAGLNSDVPLMMGIVVFSTFFVFIGNLLADVLYTMIDLRMKNGEAI